MTRRRILAVAEADLRMDGNLAMNIQRVMPVTQTDIENAAANGEIWNVEEVEEVTAPVDNMRGETLRVIKQNYILPGQNVKRVKIVTGPTPTPQITFVGPNEMSLNLNSALANSLDYVGAWGGTYQGVPDNHVALHYIENSANTIFKTDYVFGANDVELFIEFEAVNGNLPLMHAKGPNGMLGIGGSASNNIIGDLGVQLVSTIMRTAGHRYQVVLSFTGTYTKMAVKDITAGTNDVVTANGTFTPSIGQICIFGNEAGDYVPLGCKLYGAYMKVSNQYIFRYIPCRYNGYQVGLFDAVSGRFMMPNSGYVLAGTVDVITPKPNYPVEIVCNNGRLAHDPDGNIETIGVEEKIKDTIGNVAECVRLLSVAKRSDHQSILDGDVKRVCGAMVFTGGENWTYDSTYNRMVVTIPNLDGSTIARNIPGFCTHFRWLSNQESMSQILQGDCYSGGGNRMWFHTQFTSVTDWTNWLAGLFNANQGVIIAFPLETPVMETATPQVLQVQSGANTISVVESNMDHLMIEAQYTKLV